MLEILALYYDLKWSINYYKVMGPLTCNLSHVVQLGGIATDFIIIIGSYSLSFVYLGG